MLHLVVGSPYRWFWNESGHWYAFWSGFGSCLTEFAILGVVWRWFNCHEPGCYRVGLHHVEGTPYKTCRRHHPAIPDNLTHQDIVDAHEAAQNGGS